MKNLLESLDKIESHSRCNYFSKKENLNQRNKSEGSDKNLLQTDLLKEFEISEKNN
jgi:hypothetical protein